MIRIDTVFTGFAGLPGLSQLYFAGESETVAGQAHAKVVGFFNALEGYLSTSLQYQVQSEIPYVEEQTGDILDFFQQPSVSGQGTSGVEPVASATQILMQFTTGQVRDGRRIAGRTFIPGLTTEAMVNGGLGQADQIAIAAVGTAELGSAGGQPPHVVWSRPKTTSGGVAAAVTSYTVPAKLAVLRSRRD